MRHYLGRKQTSNNSDWLYAVENIENLISADEVEAYAAEAVSNIRDAASRNHVAFAWSGGKDSIVLAALCADAGVTEGYMAYCDLDYPAFVQWCKEHKPAGVTMMHTGYGLDWLSRNQELIFAQGAVGQRWHQISQRRPFTRMYFDKHLDILLVGHRTIDGNVCGRDGYIRKNSGEVRFAPMADWPHEVLLGYIHYHHLLLPPIYSWKDGYVQGTHAWPEREFCCTLEQGYRAVYDIDPSIILAAAEKIPTAKAFLAKEAGR